MTIEPARTDEAYAHLLDAQDPLGTYREEFYLPPNVLYFDGNSLGLLSRRAEQSALRLIEEWKGLAIGGWLGARPPWFTFAESLGDRLAPLVGARLGEVVLHGTTTANMHQLLATLYRPRGSRTKLLADELNFPSDQYAVESQVRLAGLDPSIDLIRATSRDGRTLDEDDLIALMGEDVALAMFPSVLYRSGQLLDMPRLTRAAHDRGVLIGFDCSHSAGVVPHHLSEWGVDFAFWCTYKYLNGGPGSIAALYLNNRHDGLQPGLTGWWGNKKQTQFDMSSSFDPAAGAGKLQLGTPQLMSAAPLEGSLSIFEEAGIEAIREKSLLLTDYLIDLADTLLPEDRSGCRIGSPRERERRGGHVALEHVAAIQITAALRRRGVIPDFRFPNVVRLAPIPLYTSFHEVWQVMDHLRAVVDGHEYEAYSPKRSVVA